jgi:hypothetical protein
MCLSQWINNDKWKGGMLKTSEGMLFYGNDQMEGVLQAIDLDWIPRYIIINKKGEKLFYTERLRF